MARCDDAINTQLRSIIIPENVFYHQFVIRRRHFYERLTFRASFKLCSERGVSVCAMCGVTQFDLVFSWMTNAPSEIRREWIKNDETHFLRAAICLGIEICVFFFLPSGRASVKQHSYKVHYQRTSGCRLKCAWHTHTYIHVVYVRSELTLNIYYRKLDKHLCSSTSWTSSKHVSYLTWTRLPDSVACALDYYRWFDGAGFSFTQDAASRRSISGSDLLVVNWWPHTRTPEDHVYTTIWNVCTFDDGVVCYILCARKCTKTLV